MRFIGQTHITKRLYSLVRHLYNTNEGGGILFRGPSGYGKTHLAMQTANYLAGRRYSHFLGNEEFDFNTGNRVFLIDEIHLCETPEVFYPLLDERKMIFIFTTNFDSKLPEALLNRCYNFIFSSYSKGELIQIFKNRCNIPLDRRVITHVIDLAGRNPRIIVNTFIPIIEIMSKYNPEFFVDPFTLINKIDEYFGVSNGLTVYCNEYLEALKSLGGRAPLDTLKNILHLDADTIKMEIEPVLLAKGLIKISSRGRELI